MACTRWSREAPSVAADEARRIGPQFQGCLPPWRLRQPASSTVASRTAPSNCYCGVCFLPQHAGSNKNTAAAGQRTHWRRPWLGIGPMNAVYLLSFLLLAGMRRAAAAAEDSFGLRPEWIPLVERGSPTDRDVAETFQSSEVLQMYHLQVSLL